MTISSLTRKAGPFAGNNIATTFPFSFKVFSKGDVKVLLVNAAGVSTLLALDSDYSVQLNANQNSAPGGWITYPVSGTPLAIGYGLVALGDLPYDQGTDITNGGGFYPNVIEDMADRSTIQIQQLAEISSRAIVVSEAESVSPVLPNAGARANSVLGFDQAGNVELFGITPAVGAGDLKNESWTAGTDFIAGTSTSVLLSRAYGTKANLGTVVMAGIAQDPASYSLVGGTTLQFDSAIPADVNRIWCVGGTTLSVYVPAQGSVGDSQLSWGDSLSRVCDSITELSSLNVAIYKRAFATGYYATGDGGGGPYVYSASMSQALANGGTIIAAAGGVGCWLLQPAGPISALQFGAYSDGTNADTNNTVFANIVAFVTAQTIKPEIFFPPGTYAYSVSPNWAVQNAVFRGVGECHFQYSGTGNAVTIDGTGQPHAGVYDMEFSGVTVDAPATALDAYFIKNCHHSRFRKLKVRGCGSSSAGIEVNGCVCSTFESPEVSPNADGGWYSGAMPQTGMLFSGETGAQASYCTVLNPVMEGLAKTTTGCGIELLGALGNIFIGGTAEGCTTGISTATAADGCSRNKFFGTDLEANTTYDIYEQGDFNEYHGVDSLLLAQVISGSVRCLFEGGTYQSIQVALGAISTTFSNTTFNRQANGGTFVNGDPSTTIKNVLNYQTGLPLTTQGSIAVGASPFTYTNKTGNAQWIGILPSGATVLALSITRNGVNEGIVSTSPSAMLAPGDSLTVTYTGGTPAMWQWSVN